jgi:hypothetical protein
MVDFPHKHLILLRIMDQAENIRQLKYRTFQQSTDPLVFRVMAQKIQQCTLTHSRIKTIFKEACEQEAVAKVSNPANFLPSGLDQVVHDTEDNIKSKYMN